MNSEKLNNLLDHKLNDLIDHFCHHNDFKERLLYTLLPAGKYIRSHLAFHLANDLAIKNQDELILLCCAIETHHTYTLIHDDLPCMDNDIYRRGRLSHHLKYSEWEAVLAGDALLSLSYQILTKIKHSNNMNIVKLLGWATGSKGLIYGQYLDLYEEKNNHSTSYSKVNLLKTARLFQVSCLGAYYLSTPNIKYKKVKEMLRLGQQIGLLFQLMDDLDDYLEGKEEESYFYNSPIKAKTELLSLYTDFQNTLNRNNLSSTKNLLNHSFFNKEDLDKKLERLTTLLNKT